MLLRFQGVGACGTWHERIDSDLPVFVGNITVFFSPFLPMSTLQVETTDLILCPTLYLNQENMNILRDAAHLQMQLRHYDGLIDTRFLLLKLRPNLRQNWIGLALAYHLNGSLPEARRVLEQYECSLKARDAADVLFCALVCSSPVHGLLERTRLRSRTVRLAALPRQSLGRYG